MYPATLHLNGRRNHGDPIYKGDDFSHVIEFEDSDGTPISKATVTILSQIRETAASTEVIATFTSDVSGAGNNVVTLSLDAATTTALPTGNFYWDYQETESGVVQTRLKGQCIIEQDVSRA